MRCKVSSRRFRQRLQISHKAADYRLVILLIYRGFLLIRAAGLFGSHFSEAIDSTELIAGGGVFLLLRDSGEVRNVVFRRHRDTPEPETFERGMLVEH